MGGEPIDDSCVEKQHCSDDAERHESYNAWDICSIYQDVDIEEERGVDGYDGDEKPYFEDPHIAFFLPVDDGINDGEEDHSDPEDEKTDEWMIIQKEGDEPDG